MGKGRKRGKKVGEGMRREERGHVVWSWESSKRKGKQDFRVIRGRMQGISDIILALVSLAKPLSVK